MRKKTAIEKEVIKQESVFGGLSTLGVSISRTKWLTGLVLVLIGAYVFLTPENSTERLVVYKLILAIIAAVIGDMVVKTLYPYIDLSKLLAEVIDKQDEQADATKFLGACILRAMVMGAIIFGVLTGI